MEHSSAAISVHNLSKTFNPRSKYPVRALADVSFDIQAGEIVGLIGPNGAGKTTFLKIALGFLAPDSGNVSLFGHHPESLEARKKIGFQADNQFTSKTVRVETFLELHSLLATSRVEPEQLRGMLDHFKLTGAAMRSLASMSKGMRQKVELVQAFIGAPSLVFLDEPTGALDPPSVFELREFLAMRKKSGTTILFRSHNLTEVEHVCDRVLFIDSGKLIGNYAMEGKDSGFLEEIFRSQIVERKAS
ncbi:MAG TPA: ATP-binding cassette domain-containing protein [Bacteroidota bacterium]|nr:ATP-binding cassette domain-containing protein [Bacteroidota bacterium]